MTTETTNTKGAPWKNRIVGYATLPPSEIVPNDKNWKQHPVFQMDSMKEIMDKIGWVQNVIVNKRTNRLIDGHMRLDLALKNKEDSVPVTYVDLSDEEEDLVLATFDPLALLSQKNSQKLLQLQSRINEQKEISSEVGREQKQKIEKFLNTSVKIQAAAMRSGTRLGVAGDQHKQELPVDSSPAELSGVHDLKIEMEFERGLPYDIPQLRPDMLSDCPEPIITWTTPDSSPKSDYYLTVVSNGNCRGMPWNQTVLCFYCDDQKFTDSWDDVSTFAKRILNRGFYAVVGPDFSIGPEQPKAARIWYTYQQRWVTRYWQEAGIRVIPNISHFQNDEDLEFFYTGIPTGVPCLSIQVQAAPVYAPEITSQDVDELELLKRFKKSLGTCVEQLKPESLLVYGGPKRDEIIEFANLPKSVHVISVENFITQRSKWLKEVRQRPVTL